MHLRHRGSLDNLREVERADRPGLCRQLGVSDAFTATASPSDERLEARRLEIESFFHGFDAMGQCP